MDINARQSLTTTLERSIVGAHLARTFDKPASSVLTTANAETTTRFTLMLERTVTQAELERLVAEHVKNVSMYPVIGYSDGQRENSVVIDIITARRDIDVILALAQRLKVQNCQREVLLTYMTVQQVLV